MTLDQQTLFSADDLIEKPHSRFEDDFYTYFNKAASFDKESLRSLKRDQGMETIGTLYHHLKQAKSAKYQSQYALAVMELILSGDLKSRGRSVKSYGISAKKAHIGAREQLFKTILTASFSLESKKKSDDLKNLIRDAEERYKKNSSKLGHIRSIKAIIEMGNSIISTWKRDKTLIQPSLSLIKAKIKGLPALTSRVERQYFTDFFSSWVISEWGYWNQDDYIKALEEAKDAAKFDDIEKATTIFPEVTSQTEEKIKRIASDISYLEGGEKIGEKMAFDLGESSHDQKRLGQQILRFLIKRNLEPLDRDLATRLLLEIKDYGQDTQQMIQDIQNAQRFADEELKSILNVILYYVKSGGECQGFSILWAFAMRISDELALSDKPKDDIHFLHQTLRKLSLWDHNLGSLSRQDIIDIETLISNVYLYQIGMSGYSARLQDNVDMLFKELEYERENTRVDVGLLDTKRGHPIKKFHGVITGTRVMLQKRMREILRPGAIVLLACASAKNSMMGIQHANHMMAAYWRKDNNKLYFFDPNERGGMKNAAKDNGMIAPNRVEQEIKDYGDGNIDFKEIPVNSIEELVNLYWSASDSSKFDANPMGGISMFDMALRNMEVYVYQFKDDPKYILPTQEDFQWSVDEIKEIGKGNWVARFLKNPHMPDIENLYVKLSDNRILELLRNPDVDRDIKKAIIHVVVLNMGSVFVRETGELIKRALANEFFDLVKEVETDAIDAEKTRKMTKIKLGWLQNHVEELENKYKRRW